MAIIYDDNLVGLWYIQTTEMQDFLAALMKDGEGFRCEYRFRYYDPEDPGNDAHSGKDTKSWYVMDIKEPDRREVLGKLRLSWAAVARMAGGQTLYEVVRQHGETTDSMVARWVAMPFVHTKEIQAQ
jgi:hypothetical protein